ncbi:MAG: alpha/beta hydrolase [Nitrosomonas sp.]|nr:alpha/beta hydrolase [Nitrosomonas sp.]
MMLRKLLTQLFALLIAILLSVFAIGQLITGSASTAVGSLSADFPVDAVQIPVNSEINVHGWLAPGVSGKGMVLLVHSMRSNRLEMLSRARFLYERGIGVLLIDLQAHGESPGKRITFGARESTSVEAAMAYLNQTYPYERKAAIGVSLGAAAIVLAKTPLKLDAVILESLHPTIKEAVENRLKLHFGEYGSILLPVLLSQLSFYLDLPTSELSPITYINNLNTPLLLIAGTDDAHTTLSETERLFLAAREPKEKWIIPGAGHFNMHSYAGKEYEQRVLSFLAPYLITNN